MASCATASLQRCYLRPSQARRPGWLAQPQSTPLFAASHQRRPPAARINLISGLLKARRPPAAAQAAAIAPAATQQPSQPQQQQSLRTLYPPSTAHASGHLRVSELHSIYYEVHGNPHGVPAVVVHGGPGAGCFPNHARFWDPRHYRIILVDQRGCGRSTPAGCLADNTTAALVGDLELLRQHLGVKQWVMLGGSWGVALSIAYAQAHPHTVLGLVLRGVCLMRPREIQWMYGGGAAAIKPLAWAAFVGALPERQRANPLLGYYQRLLSPDAAARSEAAKAWMAWEMAVGFSNQSQLLVWDGQQWSGTPHPQQPQQQLPPPPQPVGKAAAAAAAPEAGLKLHQLARGASVPAEVLAGTCSSRLDDDPVAPAASSRRRRRSDPASSGAAGCIDAEGQQEPGAWSWGLPVQGFNLEDPAVQQLVWQGLNHTGFSQQGSGHQALLEAHFSLHGAFLLEEPLLAHVGRLRHIPAIAVQGAADLVCPPVTATDLSAAWPEMELRLVPGAGHSMYDPAITHELLNATDRMRGLGPGVLDGQWSGGQRYGVAAGRACVVGATDAAGGEAGGGPPGPAPAAPPPLAAPAPPQRPPLPALKPARRPKRR